MRQSTDALRELERAWTRGDTGTLGALTTPDFRLVAPAGVIRTKRRGQCSSGSGCPRRRTSSARRARDASPRRQRVCVAVSIPRRRLRASVGRACLEKTALGPAASVTTGLAMSSAARESLVENPERPYQVRTRMNP